MNMIITQVPVAQINGWLESSDYDKMIVAREVLKLVEKNEEVVIRLEYDTSDHIKEIYLIQDELRDMILEIKEPDTSIQSHFGIKDSTLINPSGLNESRLVEFGGNE